MRMANCESESLSLYPTLDLFGGKDFNDKILGKDQDAVCRECLQIVFCGILFTLMEV